jgi:RNA methyltransferase, TrmH family
MITSSHNPRIQHLRALLAKRSEREEQKAFVVEGVRLAEEALQASWLPQSVLFTSELSERGKDLVKRFADRGVEVEEVPSSLMESITDTETSQGLLAILPLRSLEPPAALNFIVIADALRDPGNLGTMIRSAAAAGAQAVFLAPGTADPFAPKVVRSAMGAHFRLPLIAIDWEQIVWQCKAKACPPVQLLLSEASKGTPCWQLNLREPLALIIGGEADGGSPEAIKAADQLITIPMPGKSESLNAAVAASILLFEVVRQRSL